MDVYKITTKKWLFFALIFKTCDLLPFFDNSSVVYGWKSNVWILFMFFYSKSDANTETTYVSVANMVDRTIHSLQAKNPVSRLFCVLPNIVAITNKRDFDIVACKRYFYCTIVLTSFLYLCFHWCYFPLLNLLETVLHITLKLIL